MINDLQHYTAYKIIIFLYAVFKGIRKIVAQNIVYLVSIYYLISTNCIRLLYGCIIVTK